MKNSKFVIQPDESTIHPACGKKMALLCHETNVAESRYPAFYICFACRYVTQVGIGPVQQA